MLREFTYLNFMQNDYTDTMPKRSSTSASPPPADCLGLESRARETEEADEEGFFCRPMVAVCEEAEGSWMGRAMAATGKERLERKGINVVTWRLSGFPFVVQCGAWLFRW